MMPRKYRASRPEIIYTIKKGRRAKANYGLIYSSPAENYHFAVIVPKKTAKLASSRNKIKRQVRSIFMHQAITSQAANQRLTIIYYVTAIASYKQYLQELKSVFPTN